MADEPAGGQGAGGQDRDATRLALLNKLRDVTAIFYEIELRASDFGADSSNDKLFDRVNDLIKEYAALDALKDSVDIDVPQDVLEYIEAGRNPTVYTRQFSEAVVRDNQNMHGKMKAYEGFANCLEEEIAQQMPDLQKEIQAARAAT